GIRDRNVTGVQTCALPIFLLHELVHLVTGLVFGHGGTLYPFGVLHHGDLTVTAEVVALLAGPAFSLVTGILLQRWTPLRQRGDQIGRASCRERGGVAGGRG